MMFGRKDGHVETLTIAGTEVKVIYKRRNKRMYLRVKPDGTVEITAPLRTSRTYIEQFIASKTDWMTKKQAIRQQAIPVMNEEGMIVLGKRMNKQYSERQLMALLEAKIEGYIKKYWPYFEQKGCNLPEIKYRHMTKTWGVCRPTRNTITFNKKLIHQPEAFIEYVTLHELCHLLIPNHSRAFWELVEALMPDYKEHESTRLLLSE